MWYVLQSLKTGLRKVGYMPIPETEAFFPGYKRVSCGYPRHKQAFDRMTSIESNSVNKRRMSHVVCN